NSAWRDTGPSLSPAATAAAHTADTTATCCQGVAPAVNATAGASMDATTAAATTAARGHHRARATNATSGTSPAPASAVVASDTHVHSGTEAPITHAQLIADHRMIDLARGHGHRRWVIVSARATAVPVTAHAQRADAPASAA